MEKNKELVQRYFEAFTTGSVDIFDDILSQNFFVRGLHMGLEAIPLDQRGPVFFKDAAIAWRKSFPDGRVDIDEMVAENDRVLVRWTFHGTHLAEFAGLAATNHRITYAGVNGFNVVNEQLAEAWDLWDRLTLWQQLNVLPQTSEFLAKAREKVAE